MKFLQMWNCKQNKIFINLKKLVFKRVNNFIVVKCYNKNPFGTLLKQIVTKIVTLNDNVFLLFINSNCNATF